MEIPTGASATGGAAIVSKILGNKLIKDGIVGQPLVIRTGKTVDFIQAYGIGMNNMI